MACRSLEALLHQERHKTCLPEFLGMRKNLLLRYRKLPAVWRSQKLWDVPILLLEQLFPMCLDVDVLLICKLRPVGCLCQVILCWFVSVWIKEIECGRPGRPTQADKPAAQANESDSDNIVLETKIWYPVSESEIPLKSFNRPHWSYVLADIRQSCTVPISYGKVETEMALGSRLSKICQGKSNLCSLSL